MGSLSVAADSKRNPEVRQPLILTFFDVMTSPRQLIGSSASVEGGGRVDNLCKLNEEQTNLRRTPGYIEQ